LAIVPAEVAGHGDWGRTRLSEELCRLWDWRNARPPGPAGGVRAVRFGGAGVERFDLSAGAMLSIVTLTAVGLSLVVLSRLRHRYWLPRSHCYFA